MNDSKKFCHLQQVLCEEYSWEKDWFHNVDPSPGDPSEWWRTSDSFHYGYRRSQGAGVPILLSKIIDKHARRYSVDVGEVFHRGRKIMFLNEPIQRVPGYRYDTDYFETMQAVGIANSLFETELEIMGISGEIVSVAVQAEQPDFQFANEGVAENFRKTGTLQFGAYLLLWHARVLLGKPISRRKRFWLKMKPKLSGNRKSRDDISKITYDLITLIDQGCLLHPAYRPLAPNTDEYCKQCDRLFVANEHLKIIHAPPYPHR